MGEPRGGERGGTIADGLAWRQASRWTGWPPTPASASARSTVASRRPPARRPAATFRGSHRGGQATARNDHRPRRPPQSPSRLRRPDSIPTRVHPGHRSGSSSVPTEVRPATTPSVAAVPGKGGDTAGDLPDGKTARLLPTFWGRRALPAPRPRAAGPKPTRYRQGRRSPGHHCARPAGDRRTAGAMVGRCGDDVGTRP
jgi:hypothetical protein